MKMKIKIAYVSTARSDYGPSYWLIHDLFADKRFDMTLVVAGSHLSRQHGYTVEEIENDGWPIAVRIPFIDENATSLGLATGQALKSFSELFAQHRPDIVVLYGDRYELLPVATAAVINRTPLAHICGGDITEGAIDDQVRHAITKIAHVHFPSTKKSSVRIHQMGEEPWRIHHVGDPALDGFVRGDYASEDELNSVLGFMPSRDCILVTFHPPTLELEQTPIQVKELAAALNAYKGDIIITAPAPDPGADVVRTELQALARSRPHTVFVENLGRRRYKGLLKLVGAMVGNSSSGLNEAPCVPLPVVNIGSRQKGRDRAENILDVLPERSAILKGIQLALSPGFVSSLKNIENPYGDGNASGKILNVLAELPPRERLLVKHFTPFPPIL
jgi:GDP/UDP-N,N'-diacetylbacillosamine 2-epimerase (hydrolysing)